MVELAVASVKCIESSGNYGHFIAEPLEPGFSVTLGNALRRVLLSSLPGAAVTWVVIEGVQHEFSPIPYAREDVMEFILNVKELRLYPRSNQPGKLFLEVQREGKVCAADIKPSGDFDIANPELYLAALDSPQARFYVEFNVELGRGYLPAKSSNGLPLGALPVDAIFGPIRKVNFSVELIRPGQEGSPERLNLELWTDGTISPRQAVSQSAMILISQFSPFRDLELGTAKEMELAGGWAIAPKQYETSLEELNLSTRLYNSLRRGGINNLGQLLETYKQGPLSLPGLGAKSKTELEELMSKLGFPTLTKEKEE